MHQSSFADETELDRIAAVLGDIPTATVAEAHVYPAAAPDYELSPREERDHPETDQLRLYVHIPFCNYKCSFCVFATRLADGRDEQERYVEALERELEWVRPGTSLSQLFVGGGTPTALPVDLLDRVLEAVFVRLPASGQHVHTVEASPESLTEEHLRVLMERGIGRVSMGVQSLDEHVLEGVQRRHGRQQVLRSCDLLAQSGMIANVDLMYGLPGQSEESFRRDLELVLERGIQSVTLYGLRVKHRTTLGRSLKEEERLDLKRVLRWRRFVLQSTAELGLSQTRWHTFKRLETIAASHSRAPCFDSEMRGYQLGIGMSSRSHLGKTVYRNHPQLGKYVERIEAGASPVQQVFRLGEEDLRTQFIARTLGDGQPLDRTAYQRAFGTSIEGDYGAVLGALIEAGLITESVDAVEFSDAGRLVHDRLMILFYPKHALETLRAEAA